MEGLGLALLERDFLECLFADDFTNLSPLDHRLKLLLLRADNLERESVKFCRQAIKGGPVLVLDHQHQIPIISTRCRARKHLFGDDETLLLRLVHELLALNRQVAHVYVEHTGLDPDERDAPNRSFRVRLVLGNAGLSSNEEEAKHEPESCLCKTHDVGPFGGAVALGTRLPTACSGGYFSAPRFGEA